MQVKFTCRRPASVLQEFPANICGSDVSRSYLTGASPFPSLDAFIESVASFGAVTGKLN